MPKRKPPLKEATRRVKRHQRRLAATGHRRLELTGPANDVALLRQLAAKTGRDLVAFFRASSLAGVDLQLDRDRSTGRLVDL